MRLAVCALSAVLLSGCSWLGMGGQSNGYGVSNGAYGANCAPVGYGQAGSHGGVYGHGGAGAGCAGGAYGVAHGQGHGFGAGYGAGAQGFGAGYGAGAQGFGAGYGAGAQGYGPGAYGAGLNGGGAYGSGAYGTTGFGQAGYGTGFGGGNGATAFGPAGFGVGGVAPGLAAQGIGGGFAPGVNGGNFATSGVTTLGAGAPFGAAAFGGNVVGTQLSNGQYVNGQYVQNVAGAPIYVPQPYAAPYGVPQLRGVGAAMPFGFEVFGGSEFDVSGDLIGGKSAGPSDGGGGRAGGFDAISYADAFSEGKTFGGATTYDVSRNTTLIGSVGYSKKEGQSVSTGSFESGSYDASGAFTPDAGATERHLTGTFSDLEQYTIEGGVRQYMGNGYGLRPYVGASAGFAHNNDVTLTQTFNDDGTLFGEQQFIESGWNPTAAGVIGAEMAVGPRAGIGVETGIRWRDNMDANSGGDDRISIPVKLRGRLAF